MALALVVIAPAATAGDSRFGPANPVVKDATGWIKRPIGLELQLSVPDGFVVAAVGDLIISRPLSQYADRLPGFNAVIDILHGTT